MIAWAIKDYLGGFRWGRIKEAYKIGGLYFPIYMLIILPIVSDAYEDWRTAMAFFLGIFPVAFCWFAAPLHTMILPKMMYLCPLSEKQRREYLVYARGIRMGVPWLIGIIRVVLLFAMGMCDWSIGIGIFLNDTVLALILGAGINKYGYGTVSEQGQRTMNFETKAGVWESLGLILTMIFGMLYSFRMVWWDGTEGWQGKVIMLCIQLILQVPVTVHHMLCWEQALKDAMHYESSYAKG